MEGPQALLLATPDEVALAITSYLGEPRDLAHLAVAVRRFSVKAIKDPHPAAGQEAEPEEWSMVQEAARRWVAACPEAERRRVPRREGDSWLGLMHEAQALRRPIRLRGWGAQADMLALRPLPSGTEVVKVRGSAVWSSARCDAVMRAGVHFAQFTVDEDTQRIYPRIQFDAALKMMLGVVRPTAEAGADLHHTEGHCLFYTYNGAYYPTQDAWQGKQGAQEAGDRVGLLLDLDLGAMSVWKNGERKPNLRPSAACAHADAAACRCQGWGLWPPASQAPTAGPRTFSPRATLRASSQRSLRPRRRARRWRRRRCGRRCTTRRRTGWTGCSEAVNALRERRHDILERGHAARRRRDRHRLRRRIERRPRRAAHAHTADLLGRERGRAQPQDHSPLRPR